MNRNFTLTGSLSWLNKPDAILKAGKIAATALSGIAVFRFLDSSFARLQFPFMVSLHEGLILEHVRRVVAGAQLYVKPTIEFTDILYPPIYYYFSAALTMLTQEGYFPLRLVSLGSTLACFGLIGLLTFRETRNAGLAGLAVGLFASFYPWSGMFYDRARVDSLFLALWLAGLLAVRRARSPYGMATAATILVIATFTKQTGLLLTLPLVAYVWLRGSRNFLAFTLTYTLLVAGGVLLLDARNGGWFTYYVFSVPHAQGRGSQRVVELFVDPHFWGMTALLVPFALLPLSRPSETAISRDSRTFYGLVGTGALFATAIGMMKQGGLTNHAIPFLAVSSVMAAMAAARLESLSPGRKIWGLVTVGFYSVLLIQLYSLNTLFPAERILAVEPILSEEQNHSVIKAAQTVEGDVLFLHNYSDLAAWAGKRSFVNVTDLQDIFWTGENPISRDLFNQMAAALKEHRFSGVIVNFRHAYDLAQTQLGAELIELLKTHYQPTETVLAPPFTPSRTLLFRPRTNGSTSGKFNREPRHNKGQTTS